MATIATLVKVPTRLWICLSCVCMLVSATVHPISQLSYNIKDIIDKDALYGKFTGQYLTAGQFDVSLKLSSSFRKEVWDAESQRDKILDKLELRLRSIINTQTRVVTELRARTSREGINRMLTECRLNLPGLKYDQDMKTQILDKLELRLRSIINTQTRVVTELRAQTSREGINRTLTECRLNLPGLKYDQDMKTQISRNTSCVLYSGEVAPPGVQDRHILGSVSAALADEENSPRWPRRTLAFTTLDGHSVFYPVLNVSKQGLRKPQRQWLRGTLHPKPKDIVIVYDASHSMTDRAKSGTKTAAAVLKKTVLGLLSTLSTRDRVAIVVSTGGSIVPTGDADGHLGPCIRSKLAFVSRDLREYLQHQFIDRIQHSTPNISQVYRKAFQYFKNDDLHGPMSNQGRADCYCGLTERVLLAFMASRNLEAAEYEDCLRVVNEEQRALTGHLRLLGVSIKVQPAFSEPDSNYKTDRLLFDVSRSGHAMGQSSSYRSDINGTIKWFHQMFYYPGEQIFISSEFPKLGPTLHCCSHVKVHDLYVGLLCVLVPLVDIETDMGIPDYMSSYGFILDSSGNLLLYPSLRPVHNIDSPVRIESLEQSTEFKRLLPNITRGDKVDTMMDYGYTKLYRKHSPGGHPVTKKAHLNCGTIVSTDLRFCLVSIVNDWPVSVEMSDTLPDKFFYHRFEYDQFLSQQTCQHYCYEVLPNFPTFMLTKKAFEVPKSYPGQHQSPEYVHHLVRYMQNMQQAHGEDVIGTLGIKAGVRETYSIAAELAGGWKNMFYYEYEVPFNGKWLYAGFINGIFVVYPGATNDDTYDHTTRPWYNLAMSMPDKIVFTRPYIDYASDPGRQEYVISICKAITVALDTKAFPIAVLCIDHTVTHFHHVANQSLSNSQSALCTPDKTCFFIDHEGYIVSHADFMHIHKKVLDTHIMDKEPVIAKLLLEEKILQKSYCIDIGARREQPVWEVNLNGSSHVVVSNNAIDIYEVADTNIYLIVVNKPHHNRAADVGVCERQERGCQPVYSYNCSCPAPIDGCDFIYHGTPQSRALRFCSPALYGRDAEIGTTCHRKLKNLDPCNFSSKCSLRYGYRSCQDQGCKQCQWMTNNYTLTVQCVAGSECPAAPTPAIQPTRIEQLMSTTTTTDEEDVAPSSPANMYTLTIAISVIVCLLFIIVLVYICCQYPRHNVTAHNPRLTPSPNPSDWENYNDPAHWDNIRANRDYNSAQWDNDRAHDFDDIPLDDNQSEASSAPTESVYALSISSGSSRRTHTHKVISGPNLGNNGSVPVSIQPSGSGLGRDQGYRRQASQAARLESTLVRIVEDDCEASGYSNQPQASAASASSAAVDRDGDGASGSHVISSYRL